MSLEVQCTLILEWVRTLTRVGLGNILASFSIFILSGKKKSGLGQPLMLSN